LDAEHWHYPNGATVQKNSTSFYLLMYGALNANEKTLFVIACNYKMENDE
jgi:hypothetical protein